MLAMNKTYSMLSIAAAALLGVSQLAVAAPVSVNGTLGSEWTGATVKTVNFNPLAPLGNFGTPTDENHVTSYDIYTRGDGNYVYVGIQTTGNTYAGGLDFANLYFDTNPGTGSDVGFEVQNNDAFIPGVPGSYPTSAANDDIHWSMTPGTAITPGVLEFAVPNEFFTTDPLGMGFPVATTSVQLRLSQSFGYSVAGGATYGSDRLGIVAVPEPTTVGVISLGAVGLLARRRTRVAK